MIPMIFTRNKPHRVILRMIFFLLSFFFANVLFASELVGVGQYYPTLKSAFDDINNGTLTGNVVLEITSNTTETATCQLNANGFGFASYSSVKIYPIASGITINGSIFLRDADHVTIDGRVNATGSSADMKIVSTNSAISLMDAEYDKIQYCYLEGNGTVVLITGCLGTCYGNGVNYCNINHNIISYSNRYAEQFALVRFFANQPSMPHHDTISNNEFKDFFAWNQFSFGYTGVVPYGLFLGVGAYSWVIDGNSFYDTGFTLTTRNCSPRAIATSPTIGGAAHKITNNYIGGSAPMCGGAPMTITSTGTGEIKFVGIVTGANNDTMSVENNTISNINLVNCKHSATTLPYSFIGIYVYDGNTKLMFWICRPPTSAAACFSASNCGGRSVSITSLQVVSAGIVHRAPSSETGARSAAMRERSITPSIRTPFSMAGYRSVPPASGG